MVVGSARRKSWASGEIGLRALESSSSAAALTALLDVDALASFATAQGTLIAVDETAALAEAAVLDFRLEQIAGSGTGGAPQSRFFCPMHGDLSLARL